MRLTEGPVRIGSFRTYQVAIFVIVFIWAFMGFEVAQVRLVPLYEQPLVWIVWSVFVLVSIVPAVSAVAWRLKTQVVYIDPIWNLREIEIALAEYEEMMREYRREYRDYLSEIDYGLIALASIIAFTAVTIPFLLMRTTFLLIASTPIVFGLLLLLFGLVCASFVFKIMPNEATQHFPAVAPKSLRPLIETMHKSPGLSWIGVGVVLGEASGFYSIRSVSPVSRIEGIESVAMIKGETDGDGSVLKLSAMMNLDDSDSPRVIDYPDQEISTKLVAELVLKMLQIYIKEKGEEEFLDEVVEDVTLFLSHLQKNENHQSS
jgi:hypothetical protein